MKREKTDGTIFVVDDDPAIRESMRWLLESIALPVETYESADAFLDGYRRGGVGCLIVDLRMPGMSGLELLQKLASEDDLLPVILITGHADVPTAVRALQAGAMDFIEKPFNDQVLLDRVQQAIACCRRRVEEKEVKSRVSTRMSLLTSREHDVMNGVVIGKSNKIIAQDLGLSPKTIEVHRARVMFKMHAKSLPELVRMHVIAQQQKGNPSLVGAIS